MKKLFLLAGLAAFAFFGCSDGGDNPNPGDNNDGLEVERKQRASLLYYTATWCGPCGLYGSPDFKAVLENIPQNDITAIDIHTRNSQLAAFYKNNQNDTFYFSPADRAILNNLELPGTVPAFFMNGRYESSRIPLANAQSAVTATLDLDPVLGVAAKATADGNNINIETKTEFFQNAEGTYHLSAFIVEKKINFRQAVGGSYQESFEHKNILRASARNGKMDGQTEYGDLPIATGTIASGEVKELNWTFEYENIGAPNANLAAWNLDPANTAVAVIIWKDAGAKKEIVNSIMVDVE
jgi:hypothetical protein